MEGYGSVFEGDIQCLLIVQPTMSLLQALVDMLLRFPDDPTQVPDRREPFGQMISRWLQ